MDICLENPLDPPTDLKAFASLYLSYKQKTHQTTTCYAGCSGNNLTPVSNQSLVSSVIKATTSRREPNCSQSRRRHRLYISTP